jgi:hypothetical protein
MSAADIRLRLERLAVERIDAVEAGLGRNAAYMRDLEVDVAAYRAAYVGQAVTEIATLRGQLGGACFG